MVCATRITVVILELIRAPKSRLMEGMHLLGKRLMRAYARCPDDS